MNHTPALRSVLALSLLILVAATLPAFPSSETHLVLLSKLDGPPLPADLHVLEDYQAFILAEVPEEDLAALQQVYQVDLLPERTILSLNGTVWDTRQGEPAIGPALRAAPDDPYFLVQFYGPIQNEWVQELEALGVAFLGYHPSFTYIVRMDPALASRVREHHAVQWVGRYHPAYRLPSEEELALALTREGRLVLEVRGFPDVDVADLRRQLEGAGAWVEFVSPSGPPIAQAWAVPELAPRLAGLPGVYRVEAYNPPELHNDKGAQTMHTWEVWRAGRNSLLQDLMGAGQIAGAVDSGLDNNTTNPTIEDFYDYTGGTTTSRVAANQAGNGCTGLCRCRSSDDDDQGAHGTHVAGSIVGNGYLSLMQRGLTAHATAADPYFDYAWAVGAAPEARVAFAHVSGRVFGFPSLCGIGTAYTTWQSLYNAGARNVNNSWGNTTYSYGGDALNADDLMWDYQDYLVVASAGNAGQSPNTCAQPSNGKNIVTVGAALNHRSPWFLTSETASLLMYFSSRGPVNPSGGDGRFKPDVVAPGADVLSTRSNFLSGPAVVGLWGNEPGDGDGDGNPDYAWSGGTSMSAPLVTGAATILRDYFQDIQGMGNSTPPSAALIKAALVNGAVDMGYGYESLTSPPGGKVYYGGRNLQGWGFVNVEQSITPRAPRSFFFDDFTDIDNTRHTSNIGFTASGQYKEYTAVVVDPSEPLKVTLTWTDRQNGSDGFAVNNLDLRVTAPGGSVYLGNVFSGSWSTTGGSADTKNNTEAVYLQNPATGTWTIRVTDTSHGGGTQPYVLFASGGFGPNPTYTRSDTSGRAGSSGQTYGGTALDYFPSLKPLAQPEEHVPAGGISVMTFRLTNWGRSADTISLSFAATDMTGAGVANVTVAFSPAGPFALASGASQDVQATITVGGAVPNGAYDVLVTATSAGTGNRRDALVIPLNVLPDADLSNEARVVSLPGPQVMSDFWASGQTLWAGFVSGESHNNGEGKIWAACSADGGLTWTNVGQVDNDDGAHYFGPAIAGNSTGSSVTLVWVKPNLGVYARTWTQSSGCTGTWRSIQTLASYPGGNYRISYPDVIYDTDGTILATWRKNDNATGGTDGVIYSQSTNDGVSYGAAAGVPDASGTDAGHSQGQLTLDTTRNEVWLAYRNAGSGGGDIRLKRWVGSSNAWDAAGTRHIAVATTADFETRPAVSYIAATDSLWVTWHRYADAANASARLYYVRSNAGTLPNPTWGTTYQRPVGIRTAELHAAMVVGDATSAYISYLAYTDTPFRGGNVYALRVPAAGGTPDMTYQLSATVDDPPLYARGNAGAPRLLWATTTLNGSTFTGPTLLCSKNAPDSEDPDYGANLGVLQTLYNMEENFDLYMAQLGNSPTAVKLISFAARPVSAGILLTWETASERDNLGFNLYRSEAAGVQGTRLNDALIPSALPGGDLGASYEYLDAGARPAVTYYYTLEDVDFSGRRTAHGPVAAAAWHIYLPLTTR